MKHVSRDVRMYCPRNKIAHSCVRLRQSLLAIQRPAITPSDTTVTIHPVGTIPEWCITNTSTFRDPPTDKTKCRRQVVKLGERICKAECKTVL